MRYPVSLILLAILPTSLLAATPHALVKEGNKQVLEQNLDSALVSYIRAQSELDTLRPELLYNLGGVFARKGDVGRADTLYQQIAPYGGDDRLLARGDYNRGTALAQGQQFDQAIPALIDALKRDPSDQDAKINLELAMRRQQQQQQEQQQNQDQNQDDQEKQDQQEQNQDEQQQDQEQQQDEQNQQQQDQQNQDQQDQEDQQQQQPQPQDLNREMAERLLDQMEQDEKEQLKQVIRQQVPVKQKGNKKPW